MNEDYLFDGSFSRIIENEFDYNDIIELLKATDVGETELEYESLNSYDFIISYSDPTITLTTNEKNYISCISNCCSLVNIMNLRVFIIELNVHSEKPYIECAAIIKIFNLLFTDKDNLFLFIMNGKLAFGSKRLFSCNIKNNFCISCFYSFDTEREAFEFCNSCCENAQDFADTILMNSEIEIKYNNYDRNNYYLYDENLQNIIDTIRSESDDFNEQEVNNCIYYEHTEKENILTYESISKYLREIGEYRQSKTAFELLQEANKTSIDKNFSQSEINKNNENEVEKQTKDPEKILKQILDGKWEN